MALELRQQLKLSQQLVMTPQLQQAIKLLQLSRVELLETVQQELLENPFLEEAPANEPVAPQDQEEPRHEKPQDEVYDEDLSRNADWEEYLGEFASTPRTSQGRELEIAEEISPLEARYSAKPTLEGHLLWQLHLSTLTDEQKEIGEIIIGNLGSSGYLRASVEEIAEAETAAAPAESLQRESGDEGFTLEHVLGDYGQEDRVLESVALRTAIERLPEKEQQVINLRFFHGLTQSDCARILSVSQVQVSRLERRAMENLRAVML